MVKTYYLSECINMYVFIYSLHTCKELNIQCVTKGEPNRKEQLKIKRSIWRENYKEIREGLDKSDEVKHLPIPKFKKVRNYLQRMNLPDARVWFRFRCKITSHVKGNMSVNLNNKMLQMCTKLNAISYCSGDYYYCNYLQCSCIYRWFNNIFDGTKNNQR